MNEHSFDLQHDAFDECRAECRTSSNSIDARAYKRPLKYCFADTREEAHSPAFDRHVTDARVGGAASLSSSAVLFTSLCISLAMFVFA